MFYVFASMFLRFSSFFCELVMQLQRVYMTLLLVAPENIRSSRPEMFCKKGVLRNIAKFTGKQLCQSLF